MPMPDASDFLVLSIVVPMLAALAAIVAGVRWAWLIGIAAIPLTGAATLGATWLVWRGGPQRYPLGGWTAPLGIDLAADGLSCAMLLVTAVVGSGVSIYAAAYFAEPPDDAAASVSAAPSPAAFYWPLWLFLWGALNALFLSADVFNLYVALELLTLSAIGLVTLAGTRAAVAASLRYLLAALAGSLLYLAGVAILYGTYGTLDIALLGQRLAASASSQAALTLMVVGLMFKTALFPLHYWLPPAHSSAPAPVSALLSGLVVKGSFYLVLRLWFAVYPAELATPLAAALAACGTAAILWGSAQAIFAERLKTLVAYSTVAQLGYLFLVFALAWPDADGFEAWSGTVLFALSHACAKAALFLAAGTIRYVSGVDRIDQLAVVSRGLPVTFFAIGIAAVSMMGLPPSGQFVGKWMLLKVALAEGRFELALVMLAGGLLAAVYMFRVISAAFQSPQSSKAPAGSRPAPRLLEYSTLALAVGSVLLGLCSAPVLDLLRVGSPWLPAQTEQVMP